MAAVEETTLLASGQTQVPARVRKKTHAQPGDRLTWEEMADGSFLVRVRHREGLDALIGLADGLPSNDSVEMKKRAQRGGR